MRRAFSLLCFLLVAGCASQQDLNSLKWEVDALRTRLVKLESTLTERERTIDQTMKQQAELQAQYADLQNQLFTLQGSIDQINLSTGLTPGSDSKISALEKEIQGIRDALKGPLVQKSLYDTGIEKFTTGRFEEAIEDFKTFLAQNPDPGLVDNAQFWIGESLYASGKYEDAILRYDIVVKKFKGSEKAPDSLYKQGLSFLKLGDTETGTIILQQLIQEYPDTEAAAKAKKTLKGGENG
ncbi:MAG: tol-pal system protein YbgF [Desulfomonilia bacterium]